MTLQLTRRELLSAGTLGVAATLGMAACEGQPAQESEPIEQDASEEPSIVTETNAATVDGLYVNEGYVNEENDQLKLLYLLYTLHPEDENLEISSVGTRLTINDKNEYESERSIGACKYMASYYYSDFIEDVYMGSTLKVAETFKVPAADLESGRTITLENLHVEDFAEILLSTDGITHCESAEVIAKTADPDGYAEAQRLREPADEATVATVSNAINGYYWSFFTNNTSYRIEFFAPNSYTLSTMGLDTTGTYQVTNGFVVCTNGTTGAVNELPYTLNGSNVELDPATGFSVYEN
ncbi:MAG TPA: hypothetical protein IAA42_06650 [Candidatus Olsenella excrementavium]|uniref:Uncharacterized protein n=1 Tax=Candidatus Olsenella excrementavium TaxID=2838709 RepID=A0A9D1ZCB8_9ACTN|nr:hypothetical protein [Candidatus Olsenella excrementavium]